jgi:hypothetical protein
LRTRSTQARCYVRNIPEHSFRPCSGVALSWTPIDKLALPSDDTSHISFGYNKNQGLAKPKLYSISVCPFTQGERKLFGRTLYGIVGLACGLILLNYGFSLLASGFPGLLELTSQFLGANLLLGGSIAVFISVYFLLKPPAQPSSAVQPSGSVPDVGVELVVEETPPSQYSFYKHIEYVGYFFTALGLFSAVDLVLQVLIPALYNEARWWVEILLATFGVLSYAIFGSVGRLGAQEQLRQLSILPQLRILGCRLHPIRKHCRCTSVSSRG